jgi:hypothetical protein
MKRGLLVGAIVLSLASQAVAYTTKINNCSSSTTQMVFSNQNLGVLGCTNIDPNLPLQPGQGRDCTPGPSVTASPGWIVGNNDPNSPYLYGIQTAQGIANIYCFVGDDAGTVENITCSQDETICTNPELFLCEHAPGLVQHRGRRGQVEQFPECLD